MFIKTLSFTVLGIEAFPVEIEVDLTRGLPGITIVGLPDSSIKESKERIRAALKNSGFQFPNRKITVNLAPADLRKEGSGFDLPIALSILAGMEVIPKEKVLNRAFLGELSLDGRIKATRGILPAVIKAQELSLREMIVPEENLLEACLVKHFNTIGFKHLREVVDYLRGERELINKKVAYSEYHNNFELLDKYEVDFSEILGQDPAKRALEVAAAGGHNVLMIGPPGAGKTMLAQRLPTILPPLSYEEALETTKIYSVAGLLTKEKFLVNTRPFRNPHISISEAGMIGGGSPPKPGEVSLAHNGVLFLDEFPEFRRDVIEALRQPLEDGEVTITRAGFTVTYPSRFMLICAMNPCRCGYYGHPIKACQCTFQEIKKYRQKISGPILDRIDIYIEIPAVEPKELFFKNGFSHTNSSTIRARVIQARRVQETRYQTKLKTNARLKPKEIKRYCVLEVEAQNFLEKAVEKFGFSARAVHKILKVARTIADLEGCEIILKTHLAEAIRYRSLESKLWQD